MVPAVHETLRCALVAGALDIGGIGSVVDVLAAGLPTVGVRPAIVCTDSGKRVARLRAQGVEVAVVRSKAEADRALRDLSPAAIQLHGAPEPLEQAAISTGIPLVPVLHNTEIHYTRARWRRFTRVLERSFAAIAVSELVREFHSRHVPPALRARIDVVANAVPAQVAPTDEERRAARRLLEGTLGKPLADDIVFVTLARYDAQKNVAGLVSSFLSCVSSPRARLVVAGDPSDWAEWRRADAIRRCSPRAERVSLLGTSDARTLLAAADGFILDSFFEGWPVAATEASAMGLPLVLSDFGGARELVARDPAHSVLISNSCGVADEVSDGRVARARRQCRHQPNAAELGSAIDAVAARVGTLDRSFPESAVAWLGAMMSGHAEILHKAATVGGWAGWVESQGVEDRAQ
jgi:glycosyltransferase involved in cell wall biosynthesis